MKNKTKTSLKIILENDGQCKYEQRWSDFALKDGNHPIKASELIVLKLLILPEYRWLEKLILPYFEEKYCAKCLNRLNMKIDNEKETSCRDDNSINKTPFPYCFKEQTKNG